MAIPATSRRLIALLPIALGGLQVAARASGGVVQGPFQPGLRWLHAATASDHWIPCDVAFAGAQNLVWTGAGGVEGRWSVLEAPGFSPAGARLPRLEARAPAAPISSLMAVAGERADAVFGLRQEPAGGNDKRSEVARYDPLAAAAGGAFDPVWTLGLGFVSPGPASVATDREGRYVVAGVLDPGQGQVELSWIDAESGALLWRTQVAGAGLNEMVLAADGSCVAVAAGLDVYVFAADGALLEHLVRSAATPALALSGSGRVLAVGSSSRLDVFVRRPQGYRLAQTLPGTSVELAQRAALSAAGERLAIAWWDRTTGVELRLETWDLTQGARLMEFVQAGPAGGLQNVPEAVRISPDGRRVALGTWGYGDAQPELLLFDADQPVPVFSADLPGSVQDLELDRTGTRLAVAHKDAHANQFSSTGGVRFFDTGERDLQQLVAPVLGGRIELAARKSGAGSVLFLVGVRRRQALPLAGVGGGSLFLEPGSMRVYARRADPEGRADWGFDVPDVPDWLGIPWSAQAAFRIGGGTELSAVVLDPLVLHR